MSTHNICFCGEIRKILCGYPLLSVAMLQHVATDLAVYLNKRSSTELLSDHWFTNFFAKVALPKALQAKNTRMGRAKSANQGHWQLYRGKKLIGIIGLNKGRYPVNIFLISPWKHMLWVLIRSASFEPKLLPEMKLSQNFSLSESSRMTPVPEVNIQALPSFWLYVSKPLAILKTSCNFSAWILYKWLIFLIKFSL